MMKVIRGKILGQNVAIQAIKRMNIVGALELSVPRLGFALVKQYLLAILHKEKAFILFEKTFLLRGRGAAVTSKPSNKATRWIS